MADFTIVTASLCPERTLDCLTSWVRLAATPPPVTLVWSLLDDPIDARAVAQMDHRLRLTVPDLRLVVRQGGGVVPGFAAGVAQAVEDGAQAILALHSDVRMEEARWDRWVRDALDHGVKFAGFGGATGLGDARLYQLPYRPQQLARQDFVSNMREAEQHGRRVTHPEPCVVFDEFSTLGTVDWFAPAWAWLGASGIQHHAYGVALAGFAARYGAQPGMLLPVRVHHFGGTEAVALPAYHAWAKTQHESGDRGFWVQAHECVYKAFSDVLPLRLEGPLGRPEERRRGW